MSYDTEEQIDTGSDSDVETIETDVDDTSDDSQDTDSPEEKAKKNKSNWKKVSEKAKLADKLQEELEQAKAELEEWRELNPDTAKSLTEQKRLDSMESRLFFAENPDAKEHKERLDALVSKSKGALTRDEAWELIKPSIPKESESKSNFSTKSQPVNTKKDLKDLTPDEAWKLTDKAKYREWAETQGWL